MTNRLCTFFKLTFKIVSATMLNPLPATVMRRTLRGSGPNISFLKSDATMGE